MEPYHAPYTFKHRYWTGLLLFARIALYVVFALNVSNNPGVNLLAIGIVVVCLILFKGLLIHKIYKNWPIDVLELVWYFNIALVSLAKSFTLEEKESDQMVVTYVSGAIAFILFILIVTCHIVTEIFLPLWKKIKQRSDQVEVNLVNFPPSLDSDQRDPPEPTFTILQTFPHGEQPLSVLIEAGQQVQEGSRSVSRRQSERSNSVESNDDDDCSMISVDSTSPLLKEDHAGDGKCMIDKY